MSEKEWPLWEVFIRSKQGLNHKHVGSLREPLTLNWQSTMRAMCIPGVRREFPSGWWHQIMSLPLMPLKLMLFMILLILRCIVTLPFMMFRMVFNTCKR